MPAAPPDAKEVDECSPVLPQASCGKVWSPTLAVLAVLLATVGASKDFMDNFKAPCNEDEAAESSDPTCRNWKTKQNAAYDKLMGEPYRLAIRRAIATWPGA